MNPAIPRQPALAANDQYDLIVVGAGIHGACLALEAARRGLRPLLIERNDFGGATSQNSLRILHGGLRYLQSIDLKRFAESVRERNWFLQNFPGQTAPLKCLMPLYGRGLKRPSVLRLALAMNDLFSRNRNQGVSQSHHLPPGEILSQSETLRLFPMGDPEGLLGGALWHDALMTSPQRLLMEILRWTSASGGVALNYIEAQSLLIENNLVRGIEAIDRENNLRYQFLAPPGCQLQWTLVSTARQTVSSEVANYISSNTRV